MKSTTNMKSTFNRYVAASICSLLAVVGAFTSNAQQEKKQQQPVSIPDRLKAEADKAFKDGKIFFIWPQQNGPHKHSPSSNTILIPYWFATNDAKEPMPFKTAFSLVSGGIENTISTGSNKAKAEEKLPRIGGGVAIYFDFSPGNSSFSGKKSGTIYMVDPNDPKVVLSNKLSVELDFSYQRNTPSPFE